MYLILSKFGPNSNDSICPFTGHIKVIYAPICQDPDHGPAPNVGHGPVVLWSWITALNHHQVQDSLSKMIPTTVGISNKLCG